VVYHAKSHQYHPQIEGHNYILTSSSPKPTSSLNEKSDVREVGINKCVYLFLSHPIKNENLTNPTPMNVGPRCLLF